MNVHVALLPSQIDQDSLGDRIAVVIDVLRATTTIVHALAAGAETVIPCSEVDQALALRDSAPSGRVLTGGERHGKLIEGFDLDNSPFSYTPERVAGRQIAFTTTNGTRAIAAAEAAQRVLAGAFVNRQAIVEELLRSHRPVVLVCAGTDGRITAEDVLFAGAIAADLDTSTTQLSQTIRPDAIEQLGDVSPSDATRIAVNFWRACGEDPGKRLAVLEGSRGGRNLIEIGQARDIARAAEDSLFDLVPEWDHATGRIDARGRR